MINFGMQMKDVQTQTVLDYLGKRVRTDHYLAEACRRTDKTMEGVMSFIMGEAKKRASNGCAMVADNTVFDWAVHYLLEDSITEEPKQEKVKKQDDMQLSLF